MKKPEQINGRAIVTDYWEKPVPDDLMDWCASLEGYDPDGDYVGYGPTEEAAIADLKEQMETHEETNRMPLE